MKWQHLLCGVLAMALAGCGNVTTKDPDNNLEPVAYTEDVQGISQVPVQFDGSYSGDPDGFLVAWEWDFGDGETGSGEFVTHSYAALGNYDVTLTVRDNGQKEHSIGIQASIDAIDSLAGTWTLDPESGSEICDNTHASYAVLFPAAQLDVTVNGTTINGIANVTGTLLMGEFDEDGDLTLNGTGLDTHAVCGSATVDESLLATFSNATDFAGRYVISFTWTDVFCNCTQTFDMTGTR